MICCFHFPLDGRELKLLSKIVKKPNYGTIELHFLDGVLKHTSVKESFQNEHWKEQVQEGC